jgi:hypothetical protein
MVRTMEERMTRSFLDSACHRQVSGSRFIPNSLVVATDCVAPKSNYSLRTSTDSILPLTISYLLVSLFLTTPHAQANIGYSYPFCSPRRTQSRNKKQSRLIIEEMNDARNGEPERNGRSLFRIISQRSAENHLQFFYLRVTERYDGAVSNATQSIS